VQHFVRCGWADRRFSEGEVAVTVQPQLQAAIKIVAVGTELTEAATMESLNQRDRNLHER